MIELAVLIVIALIVAFAHLLYLERQKNLNKRIKTLETVMAQAVGPNLAQRLQSGGTAIKIPDREWLEEDVYDS